MEAFILPAKPDRDPALDGALDASGSLVVHPAEWWLSRYTQTEIAAFGVRHGFYAIPTTELIEWLRERIAGRKAIEIGAGNGAIGRALGIPSTDSFLQTEPMIATYYTTLGQAPVRYGANVEKLHAHDAIARHKPKLVIGAWVTHRYHEAEHWRGGNMFGVEERLVFAKSEYIAIGNQAVHGKSPAMMFAHETIAAPWLVSRAMNGSPNEIYVWKRGARQVHGPR